MTPGLFIVLVDSERMSFFQKIFDRFRPTTTVHVDGGEVVFRRGNEESGAEPWIRLAADGKIMDIGKAASTDKVGRLVELFPRNGKSEGQAIRAFCRFHLAMTSGGNPFRSRVTIVEPGFRKNFGRHAATALHDVLRADGFRTDIAEAG